MELVLITFVFGLVSASTTAAITRKLFTPCFWYWLGWILGTIGAELSAQTDTLPAVTALGQDLILRAHIGAFIGFMVSSLFFRGMSWPSHIRPRSSKVQIPLLGRSIWLMLGIQTLFGLILLIQRLSNIGISDFTGIYDVRQSFLQDVYLQASLPIKIRLYNYITLIAAIAPVLLAQDDARNRMISFRSLSFMFLASVPGGLSTGGRIWVASVFSLYAVSYFIALDVTFDYRRILRSARLLAVPLIVLLALFTGIGWFRDVIVQGVGVTEVTESNPVLAALSPLYNYAGVSVSAIGPYSEFASSQPLSLGRFTFPWFVSQFARFGASSDDEFLQFISDARAFVKQNFDWRLGSTHASIIPLLIADFGEGNLLIVITVFTGMLQFVFLLFGRKWIWGYVLGTVICLYGGAFAFQDAAIGTATAVIPVLAGMAYKLWRSVLIGKASRDRTHPEHIPLPQLSK